MNVYNVYSKTISFCRHRADAFSLVLDIVSFTSGVVFIVRRVYYSLRYLFSDADFSFGLTDKLHTLAQQLLLPPTLHAFG